MYSNTFFLTLALPLIAIHVDDNECGFDNGGCDHVCKNEHGSRKCSCNPGFTLSPDGRTCDGTYTFDQLP